MLPALLSLTLLLSAAPTNGAEDQGAVPRPVPQITLTSLEGNQVSFESLRSKVVFVDFWASWCVPCARSFPLVDRMRAEYASQGFEVLAVNVDENRRDAELFLKKHPSALRILMDSRGAAADAFRVKAMPTSFIVDRRGQIRFIHVGYTEKSLAQCRREIEQLLTEVPPAQ